MNIAEQLGRSAYEGYIADSDGKSLISGADLRQWESLPDNIKSAWLAAANAAVKKWRGLNE